MSQRIERISSDLSKKMLDLSFRDTEKYRNISSKSRLLEVVERVTRSQLLQSDRRKGQKSNPPRAT